MRRSVEFDLQTRSEANRRGRTPLAAVIHSREVAAQRKTVADELARSFGAIVPPLHVQDGATMRPNRIEVLLERLAPGVLDDDNLRPALKAVRDAVAKWVGVPNDRDPIYTWRYGQEKTAAHVYRVRVTITDMQPGADRVVVRAETASEGRKAKKRVNDGIKRAGRVQSYQPAEAARGASSAARSAAEDAFGKLTAQKDATYRSDAYSVHAPPPARLHASTYDQPTALDLRDAAERVLGGHPTREAAQVECDRANAPLSVVIDAQGVERLRAFGKAHPKGFTPPRDPGEERPARDLAPCTTCGVGTGAPCREDVPGPRSFGVHVARAQAAGVASFEQRRQAKAPTNGQRRIVPPAGQAPQHPAWVRLPYEQTVCTTCGGRGDDGGGISRGIACEPCNGSGVLGSKVTRYPPLDHHTEPTARITVPPEHRSKHGPAVTLTRRELRHPKLGTVWLYE